RAAERRDGPDPRREAQPHHDDARHLPRRRGVVRAGRGGDRDGGPERDRDQRPCAAIVPATTLAAHGLAHAQTHFEYEPAGERDVGRRHCTVARTGTALARSTVTAITTHA